MIPSYDVEKVRDEIFSELKLRKTELGGFCGKWCGTGSSIEKRSPIDGTLLGEIRPVTDDEYEQIIVAAQNAYTSWRTVPAPKRGEVVRQFGERLRQLKAPLGRLVSLETGKILAEGEGEVQEMIDICDFATGLSRQLYGLTIPSERTGHRMLEQWHPLGVVGIISAFNFPTAVWSWNATLAVVCGNATLWKPSEKTPLSAIACVKIAEQVCHQAGVDPAIFSLIVGDGFTGSRLAADNRVPLVSATGSTRMGKRVAETVSARFGKMLLELGGNNALIVTPSGDLRLALRAILFGAVGTAGQRCTTTRRLIVQRSVLERLVNALIASYDQVRIVTRCTRRR